MLITWWRLWCVQANRALDKAAREVDGCKRRAQEAEEALATRAASRMAYEKEVRGYDRE
jgi:hypothetical protein